jgi:outer membrane protein OmpA-like peptidoglycan-associated protein
MNYVSNNIKKISALLFVGSVSFSIFAQDGENLVPNGSFETTDGKVKKLGALFSATGWESPTGMSADLFTPGKVLEINTPENIYGKEAPKEGSNYAGIVAYSVGKPPKLARSYAMTRLESPLKKGKRYCVKFNVSLAEASKYASNNIAANFSKKPHSSTVKLPLIEKSHIVHPENDNIKFNKTFSWEQICGTYVAEGGEKYITIGNFTADDKTRSERNPKPKDLKVAQVIAAYYYLDDVSVVLLDDEESCNCLIAEEKNEFSTTIYQKVVNLNDKMSVNEMIQAQQLFFGFGKETLSPMGQDALDFIAEKMAANPALKLEVQGHSDAMEDKVGEEREAFADMDTKRLNAVISYLYEKGIAESRLIPSAQGSESPNEDSSDSDEDDLKLAKNRRVTFKVR